VARFALCLGASFWFDVLDKFIMVRSTVKSGAEGSKERQTPAPPG